MRAERDKMGQFLTLIPLLTILMGCAHLETNGPKDLINTSNNRLDVKPEVLVNELDTPWGIGFLPDAMLITERAGTVSMYDTTHRKIAELNVTEISEAGLLGIAVHPDFKSNKHIYLYYTYEIQERPVNRVSRFVLSEDELLSEEVLLDGIPSARFHNGGRIRFGPDGKLYITTGDATVPSSSQDLDSLAGKILRVNPDGSVPEDNPFGNYVYSYGHRNPQGLAWYGNTLFSSEHGPSRHDEINIVVKGGNYGWPDNCEDQEKNTIQPIRCYTEFTLAPGSLEYHDGSLYVTGLRGTHLRRLELQDEKVVSESIVLDGKGRLREVIAHDGLLYISTSNRDGRGVPRLNDDKIIRLDPVGN